MRCFFTFFLSLLCFCALAQKPRQLPAVRTTAALKIDGELTEAAWKTAVPATRFVEWRPNPGREEDSANRTVVYILYDNTSVYVGGYCYERAKDSISRELIGRDKVGINDFVGITFDTYYDKINAVGFYVTPYGEQFDARYSNSDRGEDDSWNAVWDSEARVHDNGWSFEMRIPYSALRFVSRENQTWGLNITRRRNKTGQQFMWNPIDPKVNGFINQEGEWTGIEKIESPVRLSFSPYLSSYVSHFPARKVYKNPAMKNWATSINGGMDVKYGISESFTLDMTLIPDFGQVVSDNQVLNLSPFEVQFQENRPFFTEGTELFSKGNLFYSRRVGSRPINYGKAYQINPAVDTVIDNPVQSKLVNATKVSGRTRKGLGVGIFNAVAQETFATIENKITGEQRKVQTSPLTNYNILVFDQTLKNNSAVSLINTNVMRSGRERDANVTAGLFTFNNKKNTFNWNGKFSVSQISRPEGEPQNGYSHALGLGKTGGRWMFRVSQELTDHQYNINDMGLLFNNNFVDHSLWTGYRWLKPKGWYNRIGINYNATLSRRYRPGDYQIFYTNVNGNVQLKNLWFVGGFIGYNAQGNDFYEPRRAGYFFQTPASLRYATWIETNSAKKYSAEGSVFVSHTPFFKGTSRNINLVQRYRFSDKFSLSQDLNWGRAKNDVGFSSNTYNVTDILLARRMRTTIENVIRAKYNFNNRSGITFRLRHYWSRVEEKELLDLQGDGSVKPTLHREQTPDIFNVNIFNIDAQYTLQFAPGSFVNIVWKDEGFNDNLSGHNGYFKNFEKTVSAPQNNTLSLRIVYFLDYLDIKKWRERRSVNRSTGR